MLRRQQWKERQKKKRKGIDPEQEHARDRALKALFLIKQHLNKEITLSQTEITTLCAVVVERSSDLFFFAKHVLGFDLLTEKTHKRWADNLIKVVKKGTKRILRLKPRGSYKTTLYGIAFVLWVWGYISPQVRIFYTSSNKLLLDEVADSLSQFIGTQKNETLYSFIFGVTRDELAKNTSDVFNLQGRKGKGFSLILRTSGSSTVGVHPNLIIVDDPLNEDDRDHELERKNKERWFDTLNPLIVPFHDEKTDITFESIYYIGTRWHLRDLVWYITDKLVKEKGQEWDIESESIVGPDGHSAYPELITDEQIAHLKSSMSEIFWSCQYLNNPLPEGLQTFDLKRLSFIRPSQFKEVFRYGQLICGFDPSLGKKHSDFPAVWWAHYFNDTITFFDAIDEKVELTLLVHQIAARNKLYRCRKMVFEDNGVTLVEKAIKNAHERIGWRMDIDPVHHGSDSNKNERIVSTQPDLYSGYVRFLSDYERRYPEAMNQIVFYGAYGNDDFPDAMEMIISYFRGVHFEFTRYDGKL